MGNSTLPVIIELPSDSLTTRTPGVALERVERIAAIHALAEYFAEHPEIPVPTGFDLRAIAVNPYDSTEAERARALERVVRWGTRNDARVHTHTYPGIHPDESTTGVAADIDLEIPGPLTVRYTYGIAAARRDLLTVRNGGAR